MNITAIVITSIICGTLIIVKVLNRVFADKTEAAKERMLNSFVDKCADRIEKWENQE